MPGKQKDDIGLVVDYKDVQRVSHGRTILAIRANVMTPPLQSGELGRGAGHSRRAVTGSRSARQCFFIC
jgi:hypothetical protein